MSPRPKWLLVLQAASQILAAIPAVGLGWLLLVEAFTEPGGFSLNRLFHLLLGVVLLALFCEFAVAIGRCRNSLLVVALGTGGFGAVVFAAVVSELLGPPVLLMVLTVIAVWGARLLRSHRATGHVEPALPH